MDSNTAGESSARHGARTRRGACARAGGMPGGASTAPRRRQGDARSPVDPKALLAHPALRVGRQHAHRPRSCDGEPRHARAREGIPARPDHAQAAPRRLLPRRDGQGADRSRCRSSSRARPKGVKQQGGIVDFVHREIEIECLPADIPENIDGRRQRADAEPGHPRRATCRPSAKWTPVSDPDTMIVHVVALEGRGGAGGRRTRGGGAGDAGRARGHQEGQDRRRKTRRKRRRSDVKLRRRARQSRAASTRARGTTSASRSSTSWRGAQASTFEIARRPRRSWRDWRSAPDVLLAKPLTFMNLSGQAVGELLRYFKIELGRPARRRRRGAAAARAAAGAGARIGGRAQRAEVDHRSTSGTDEFARLRVGVGRGDAAARSRGSRAGDVRPGRAAGRRARRSTRAADAVEAVRRARASSR